LDNGEKLKLYDESFASVAEHAPAMLWRGDEHGKCVYLNRAQREFWGVSDDGVESFSWSSTLLPEDAEKVFGPFSQGMAAQKAFQCEGRYRRADGVIRILATSAEPRFDASGRFTGMIGVNRDVTEERQAQGDLADSEARRRLLMREMSHRMKNMLSTVISIASQTARSASSIEAFQTSFQARLRALSKSHDLLLRDASDSADLREILEAELRPYADSARALTLEGDPVGLSGRAALGFALVVHELATNAAKYGPFAASGSVDVVWRDEDGAIVLHWRESGGAPVSAPVRQGFGSRLIAAVVKNDLGGVIETDFSSGGLVATLRFARQGATP
jgi:PAS domain S-box-containing protein